MPSTSTPISQTFDRLRAERSMAFMPFITAGDPDVGVTQRLILELAARKVDLIEIGFPYSDPIADGPVIQASYTRALGRQIRVEQIFAAVGELSADAGGAALPPLVAMVSYAIIFRMGSAQFVREARAAGFSGLIVPDLPAEEAEDLSTLATAQGLDLVQLVAPTTPPERIQRILETSRGFLYCISVAGTTGVRDQLPEELKAQLQWLKSRSSLPLAVGFGISRPEQVHELRGLADGVIVGSALVRQVAAISDQGLSVETAVNNVGALAARFVAATQQTSG
ncbi:MAG: tryptophan synthase subunit alpha [Planctomycetales bacterium]